MRGLTPDGLHARVSARLDARLERDVSHPVAVALSGGGDSMALLGLAADWAARRGRRMLAITVDHGLNPDSGRWNAVCERAAARAGADWTLRRWSGDKPSTGLPAAARAARHALVAEAAREVGARVVLFGHTADDAREGEWMRARGSTLGMVREWSPSPAWPEGRGLMLSRPLLGERRQGLRDWLTARGPDWIDDPANDDTRFARTRARRDIFLLPAGEGGSRSEPDEGQASTSEHHSPLTLSRQNERCALVRSSPLPLGEGFNVVRSTAPDALAAVLLCASGTTVPPRGDRLERLASRLRSGENFVVTLAGASIVADGDAVIVGREPGRRRCPETRLPAGTPTVWDDRYEITVPDAGYTVAPAAGCLNRLSQADRFVLKSVAAPLRPTLPVLIRDDGSPPVLAWRQAGVRALGPRRLSLALGETTHERDLGRTIHGETPPTDLFSIKELHKDVPPGPSPERKPR